MRRFVRLLLVASVLYGTGAFWAALQGAAWAGMVATRVGESSLTETVTSVFSGEKPCGVCKFVEKGSATEKNPASLVVAPSLELALCSGPDFRVELPQCGFAGGESAFGSVAPSCPPVPPPVAVLPA